LEAKIKGRVHSIPIKNEENTVRNTGTSEYDLKPKLISHLFPRLKTINRKMIAKKMIN
jgi:hypothetical protein